MVTVGDRVAIGRQYIGDVVRLPEPGLALVLWADGIASPVTTRNVTVLGHEPKGSGHRWNVRRRPVLVIDHDAPGSLRWCWLWVATSPGTTRAGLRITHRGITLDGVLAAVAADERDLTPWSTRRARWR